MKAVDALLATATLRVIAFYLPKKTEMRLQD